MEKYREIAKSFDAYLRCKETNNSYIDTHKDNIDKLVASLHIGSGFNYDFCFDYTNSKKDKLVINSYYDYMDGNGYYDAVIFFEITITPSLSFGYDLKIKIQNKKNELYDYFYQTLSYLLEETI